MNQSSNTRQFITMNLCRTCLQTPANKNISELEKDINEENKSYFYIMAFCLDINIKVKEDLKITTNLCNTCYEKIISFYKFKVLSLKNDAYLKSLDPNLVQEDKKPAFVYEEVVEHKNILGSRECTGLDENCIKIEVTLEEVNILEEVKEEIGGETSGDYPTHGSGDYTLEHNAVYVEASEIIAKKTKHRSVSDRFKKKAPKHEKTSKPNKRSSNVKNGRKICKDCGASVVDLRAHMLTHQPADKRKMLQCKACPKTFLSKTGRRRHYKATHLGIREKCDICDKEFVKLADHKMQIHNPSALPYGCATCERRFLSKAALELHMVSHTGQEPVHECDICQRKFHAKSHVAHHIRQFHNRERNHRCNLCPKAYYSSTELKEHLRTHTNERSYLCPECGKGFMTKNCLRIHRTLHSDIKLLKCEVCDKSFRIASVLKQHMASHMDEKPYPCQYCGKRFGRPYHCRRHEAGHLKCATPPD